MWAPATQAVPGEGPADAAIMFVGEQPGDQEDLAGHPFVGPAGQVFDRALAAAGVDRRRAYVTNAVKHFKFEQRGKRRIHSKPTRAEIVACKPWLATELATETGASIMASFGLSTGIGACARATASMHGPKAEQVNRIPSARDRSILVVMPHAVHVAVYDDPSGMMGMKNRENARFRRSTRCAATLPQFGHVARASPRFRDEFLKPKMKNIGPA